MDAFILHVNRIFFITMHASLLTLLWLPIRTPDLILCAVLYALRMFGVTAGYHRYFSHKAFQTNRVCQFLLACLAQSSAQKGVLWWSSHHRHHHVKSDTDQDVHSPRHHGFLYSHLGWWFGPDYRHTDHTIVSDFSRYPELRWLNRFHMIPALLLAGACYLYGGWPTLIVGFVLSTVILYHATFSINSLAHVWGHRRFATEDDSKNNFWLALITLGEGWHNNHHHYPHSARQGFRWWEIDLSYYLLKLGAILRLVSRLRPVPDHKKENHR